MKRRGQSRGQGPRRCEVAGCGAPRSYRQAVCSACWSRLPPDQRTAITRARENGNIGIWFSLVTTARQWLERHAPAAIAARRLGEGE